MLAAAFRTFAALLLVVLGLTACDDPTSPEDRVAGRYEATTFTVQTELGLIDFLRAGADFEITLHRDGTTSGFVFVPGADEGGTDFSEDLTGTWRVDGTRVTFHHEADTFIRDAEFMLRGQDLVMSEDGINVVLSRR